MKEFDVKEMSSLGVGQSDMKDYINQLVNELRDDMEVYEQVKKLDLTVGEVRDNIAKLTDFKDDYNYCKKCPGIDKCAKHIPHINMVISKDGGYISASYQPCSKIMEQISVDNKYLVAEFPSEWKKSSLKTLDLSDNRRLIIKEFANILKGESNRWLFVNGNHKTGKSFLLVTFANEFVAMGLGQVAVVNTSSLTKKLADLSYSNKDEFSRLLVALANVPLLVFDDFGEEYKNEYIRDQIIIPILSEREHSSRLTFFTSEFTISEIQQMYSVGKAGGNIRGKQLGNILSSMCEKEFDLTGAAIYRK